MVPTARQGCMDPQSFTTAFHDNSKAVVPILTTNDLDRRIENKMKLHLGILAPERNLKSIPAMELTPLAQVVKDYDPRKAIRMPVLPTYDSVGNPVAQCQNVRDLVKFVSKHDEELCQAFPTTLEGRRRT
ncbi:hypothetical protein LIER_22546 [Lithospermum erythrorhizon]|uniref:Uncharacterized protein n=1 Tax=Lithospermum erythrorhizon TaxID=34254 RepID=A0AAV3QWK7_LITER